MTIVKWLFAVLVIAAVTHAALLYFGPSLVMNRAMAVVAAGSGINTMSHAPRPTADTDRIVRSSPDLLYSICPYDLGDGPLRINAEVPPGTYWSMSFYDMNTNNYRVINDGQASAGAVLIVLMKAGTLGPAPAGAELVASPTPRGIVLIRTLVNDERSLQAIDTVRRRAACTTLQMPLE